MDSYIQRSYFADLVHEITHGSKIIILYGPRQVGKTTLVREVLKHVSGRHLVINADNSPIVDVLSSRNISRLSDLVSGYEVLFVDEAQRVPEIGINLKILHDEMPQLKLLVTGSSSLELASKTREALTGRTLSYQLYPISILELEKAHTRFELRQQLDSQLIYGMYPDILTQEDKTKKIRYLRELASSFLYKDILELTNIKHADKLTDLLRLIAFQIGSEVSLTELGGQLGMAKETVETYLDLLEKSFVIFRLRGYSKNLRKEVTKMNKYYFYDLGIRNIIIENLNPLSLRNDVGALWENFLIVERRKSLAYSNSYGGFYFWRTYDQQEIDYVEEKDGQLNAFEFKYGHKKVKVPAAWAKAYPEASFQNINPENYLEFLGIK